MHNSLTRDGLSPNVQRLVDLLADVGFGTIENLVVRAGEPYFDPPPRIYRTVKFKSAADKPQTHADGEIKNQTLHLIQELRRVGDGEVQRLEVQAGLPFKMVVQDLEEGGSND